MIWTLKVPKGRTTVLNIASAKLSIDLTDGDIISRVAYILTNDPCDTPIDCLILYPTIKFPPTSFGTRDHPYSDMVVDKVTSNPVTVSIIMGYFTRAGDKLECTGDREKMEQIQVNLHLSDR